MIAGTPHARISRDGGRTFPARHARPLPADPPGQPCTVPVYDAGTGTGRMLALDLDPARGRGPGDPAAQADAITALVTRLGGRAIINVPRAVTAVSSSHSPPRFPGASCAIWPGPWRSASL